MTVNKHFFLPGKGHNCYIWPMNYLAMCCILKNEDSFFPEWLTYHSLIGFEHFYMYDNESDNKIRLHPLVQKYMKAGRITVIRIEGTAMQMPAYDHCLQSFGQKNKWIAFFDLDEFICFDNGSDLRPHLASFEPYAAVGVNWRSFGSSGHLKRPEGLVIENYTEVLPPANRDLHIKSIVQPAKVTKTADNPHAFYPVKGFWAVNTSHTPAHSGNYLAPLQETNIHLNHYITKSQQDYEAKRIRGRADTGKGITVQYNNFYNTFCRPGTPNSTILRFVPQVKKLLAEETLHLSMASNTATALQKKAAPCGDYLNAAKELYEQGHTEDALTMLCYASALFPKDALPQVMRCRHYRRQADFSSAERFIYAALNLAGSKEVYTELFKLYCAKGDVAEASKTLNFILNSHIAGSPGSLGSIDAKEKATLEQALKTAQAGLA